MRPYFSERHEFIIYWNHKSPLLLINHSIPQGSILAPILFLSLCKWLSVILLWSSCYSICGWDHNSQSINLSLTNNSIQQIIPKAIVSCWCKSGTQMKKYELIMDNNGQTVNEKLTKKKLHHFQNLWISWSYFHTAVFAHMKKSTIRLFINIIKIIEGKHFRYQILKWINNSWFTKYTNYTKCILNIDVHFLQIRVYFFTLIFLRKIQIKFLVNDLNRQISK